MPTRSLPILALLLLAACSPVASQAQDALPQAQTSPRPTKTAAPPVVPTMNAQLVARITEANIELAEAQAELSRLQSEQYALDMRLTQSSATGTAWPPTATQGAVLLAYAGQTQTQNTAIVETAQAHAPTQTVVVERLLRERRTAPIRTGITLSSLVLAVGFVFVLTGVIVWRRRAEIRYLATLTEEQEIQNDERRLRLTPAKPDSFISHDYQRVLRPIVPTGVTDDHIRRIAAWVVEHDYTWSDAMRNGQGVGLAHPLLKSYRDGYLVRAGALERVGSNFIVTSLGREYFERKAAPLGTPAGSPSPTHGISPMEMIPLVGQTTVGGNGAEGEGL